jgi:glycosyltransferase involved in cell wall biosynthesis
MNIHYASAPSQTSSDTKTPLVSLITPAYNQAAFLQETIDSVLAQTFAGIEYFVLDDGSTDHTPDILRANAGRLHVESQANIGQARTLNKGWERATGKYLGYLSSDDILYPRAIETLVRVLEADDSIVCVFPDCDLIDSRSKVIKRQVCRPFDLEELVVRQECYIGPGALFRRRAFEVVGGWRAELKLAPDREFWMRLATQGRFDFSRDTLAGYRMHPHSISYKDVSEEVGREYIWVLNEYFNNSTYPPRPSLLARKSEAYGYATLVLARNCLRAGRWSRARELYREACRWHPPLSGSAVKARLLKNVVSKPARVAVAAARALVRG